MGHIEAGCAYCKTDIFLKVKVYTKPIQAPLTHEQEIIDELLDKIGYTYSLLQKRFCSQ